SIASTPQQVAKLLRSVPGLRLTLDYSHFVFQGIEPVEIDPLLRQSRVLQVRQAGPGMLQLPLEEGTIDFRRLFAVSARLFEGTYSLEYVHNPVFRGGEVDVTGESLKLLAVFDASEASRAPTGGERLNG
ncbi:MAG TPA: hypothetical protein VNG12_04945, partial [Acidimicrobiales bacterium]|nr:hypothetical protein [Acidimicrobiales bacterium]